MRSYAADRGESHAMQCPFQSGVHCHEEKGMMIPLLELSDTRDDKIHYAKTSDPSFACLAAQQCLFMAVLSCRAPLCPALG